MYSVLSPKTFPTVTKTLTAIILRKNGKNQENNLAPKVGAYSQEIMMLFNSSIFSALKI